MSTVIVTAGSKYADIDVLACTHAYSSLLNLQGQNSRAVITAPLNSTIPAYVKELPLDFESEAPQNPAEHKYVLMDVSNPDFFETFVLADRIIEVFDHHFGYEKYWNEKLASKSCIEKLGACATLVWEQYIKSGFADQISELNAHLLAIAIISNSLNFKSYTTDARDKRAIRQLSNLNLLPRNWLEDYFKAVSDEITSDIPRAIKHDTKTKIFNGNTFKIAQVELWDSKEFFLEKNLVEQIQGSMELASNDLWFLILSDISTGTTRLLTSCTLTKSILSNILPVRFSGMVGDLERLWMRKEIIREFNNYQREGELL